MRLTHFLSLSVVAIFMVACHSEPKDYVTLSGHIDNQNSDSLLVRSRSYSKKIDVDANGNFKDTLKVESGNYTLFDGKEQAYLYLQNGNELNVTLNTDKFDGSIVFEGNGSEANNYLAEKTLVQHGLLYDFSIYELDKKEFEQKITSAFQNMRSILNHSTNLSSDFVAQEKKSMQQLIKTLHNNYDDRQYMKSVLAKGNPSPVFENYHNYKGGETSLSDLKGKYVYIDVWATWCGPCKAEIPFLKAMEKAYHGKNIEFVSISVDKQADKDKWEEMIVEKELSGLQLLADKDFQSEFVQDYAIRGIPRFILIDPEGNIVDANAPRPSNEKLAILFDALNI